MRILRNGSIYDSFLKKILDDGHLSIRTSFPLRVKKALIKRKYENFRRADGKLRFRVIAPKEMEYEEYVRKAEDLKYETSQLKNEEKFVLDITLEKGR